MHLNTHHNTPSPTHLLGGLITASTLALLGLVVIPYRRSAQRADFRRRVGELRTQMDQALAVRCVRGSSKNVFVLFWVGAGCVPVFFSFIYCVTRCAVRIESCEYRILTKKIHTKTKIPTPTPPGWTASWARCATASRSASGPTRASSRWRRRGSRPWGGSWGRWTGPCTRCGGACREKKGGKGGGGSGR